MSSADTASDAIGIFNTYAWYIAFIFLIGLGLYFAYRLKGEQITQIKESSKLAFTIKSDSEKTDHISSFEAFCVGLGARIGVGNIAGVATAIVLGGPGAVFWMWIFAIIGAGTSFMECTLGQIFKERKSDGLFHGGPAYYIKNGLHRKYYSLLLAFMVIALYGIGFIGVQASNATDAFTNAFDFENNQLIIAILITIAAAAIIFGGIRRVAKASTKIVPVMALMWMIIAIVAIISNISGIGNAFNMIFEGAFGVKEFVAGGMGMAIMMGLKRGVFSNEAGIGSIPNVASSAHVKHPVKQGLIQSLGVLIDTLVVCSATAFVILTYGSFDQIVSVASDGGAPLVQGILNEGFLGSLAPAILAVFMIVFAFSSLIGYYSMCEANTKFISDSPIATKLIRVIIIAVVFISSMIPLTLMWDLCDALMAVMGVLNMLAVGMLSKYAFRLYKDYRAQRKAGIETPEFNLESDVLEGMDVSGITCWNKE